MDQTLKVVDSRTGKSYTIPIQHGDYILAADLAQISGNSFMNGAGGNKAEITRPLRILDRGYQHTACMESSITFM